PRERLAVLAHCYAGWAYAWASPAEPSREVEEKGVIYTSLAHPAALSTATGLVFATSTLALVAALAARWRSERRLPPLGPPAGFLITVWLWTIYTSLDRLMMYVIPALHSIQYLYMVWLQERNRARAGEGPPDFGRPPVKHLAILTAASLGLAWLL